MKKLKLPKLPRKVQVLLNIVLTVLLLLVLYVVSGAPTLTNKHGYRRAEKRNFVGPSEIIGEIDVLRKYSHEKFLLGESEYGLFIYNCQREQMYYKEKTGSVTLAAVPFHAYMEEFDLPIVLVDDHPDAVRAEIDIHLYTDAYGEMETFDYSLEAERENDGYFLFWLNCDFEHGERQHEQYAVQTFTEMIESHAYSVDDAFPVDVRMYDKNDELIYTEQLILRSGAGKAHFERNEVRQ